MFQLELYKIFKRKLVLILLLGILILVILCEWFTNSGWYFNERQKDDLQYQLELYETHKGILTEEGIKKYQKLQNFEDDIAWVDFDNNDFYIHFGYYRLWNWYLDGSLVRYMKFAFVFVSVVFSMLFAYEKECGLQEILLSTKNGRKKCTKAKIMAAFLITNSLYLLLLIIAVLPLLILTRGIGWDTSIQMWLHSELNLNNIALLFHAMLLSFLAVNTALLITLFASFLAKSPMTAMCGSLGLLLVLRPDMIIANVTENKIISWITSLTPINVLEVSNLTRQESISIGGMKIHCLTIAEIAYTLILVTGSIIFFRVLAKHQKYYAS